MTEQPAPSPEQPKGNGVNQRLSQAMKAAHARNPGAWKKQIDATLQKRDNKIRAALKANPKASAANIARKLKIHTKRVYRVMQIDGIVPATRGTHAAVAEMRAKIMTLDRAGLTKADIMKRLGVTEAQVEKARRAARMQKPERFRTTRDISAEKTEQVKALISQGLHPNVIASRLGMHISSVYYHKARFEGRQRPSDKARRLAAPRVEHAEQPFAETVNWLKHGYQEVLAAIRKGRDPTISDCYTIVAYLKATGK